MEERQRQIQECREQLRELTRRVDALSARIDRLEGKAVLAVEAPVPQPRKTPATPQPQKNPGKGADLEGFVGKNLFAVLASVLVLVGVSVFISTIYEYIPEIVKICAIYVFGLAMLGGGLVVYRGNGNKFWLGVASCGLAELLVSIITSHTYFQVLSLPWAFLLILVWVLSSFWLTRFHPVVFKSIGYAGFIISVVLGLDLLERRELVIYLTLAAAYTALSLFFMVTHRKHRNLNTVMAFCSILGLLLFGGLPGRLPMNWGWMGGILVLAALILFHRAYLLVGKLRSEAYPFFAGLSLAVWSLFLPDWELAYLVPAALTAVLILWYLSQRTTGERVGRICFAVFVGLYLYTMGSYVHDENEIVMLWFVAFAVAATELYRRTGRRDMAWLGLVGCAVFCVFADLGSYMVPLAFGLAAAFFACYSSPLVRGDKPLRAGWYLLTLAASWLLINWIWDRLWEIGDINWQTADICFGVYNGILAVVNTVYLHLSLRDKEKLLRLDPRSVALMIPQFLLILGTMNYIGSDIWYVSLLAVASSLVIVTYSLHYSLRTRGRENNLMIWQFVKLTLYCWAVLFLLESPDILLNICLLVIAIAAIGLGFRLGHKAVRIYGLMLSLVDVVGLVLMNIDFSDSLQLAGGIVLCGALCFVISFIYSRISRTTRNKDAV